MTTPTPSDATPQALADALQARAARRRRANRWKILPNEQDSVQSLADSINSSKHQRLTDRFRPDGWITEYL